MNITRTRILHPKRYPFYPTHGKFQSKFQIELDGNRRWKRVYFAHERKDDAKTFTAALFILEDGVSYRRLSDEDAKMIGFDLDTCQNREDGDRSKR